MTIFSSYFVNFLLKAVSIILWKSDKPVSTKQLLQKLCGLLIRSKSIQEWFCSFFRKKGCLTRFLKSQTHKRFSHNTHVFLH